MADARRLGRFLVQDEIGRGGMGRVLAAHDGGLGRVVAIKVLHPETARDPGDRARAVAEARVTAQLEHPHIVPVYDVGEDEHGAPWFVMRRVEGRSLRELLDAFARGEEPAWSLRRLLGAFLAVCRAVEYAHSRGVLHRDLKPGNVMLGRFGEVYVLDWGVSRRLDPAGGHAGGTREHPAPSITEGAPLDGPRAGLTQVGASLGTPGFMSPEQAQARPDLDARSDVFSLGAILYELLTLQPAFPGPTPEAVLFASVVGPPVPPRETAPSRHIPEDLDALCVRALQADPRERWPSVAAFAEALEAALDGAGRRERARSAMEGASDAREQQIALRDERALLDADRAALRARVLPSTAIEEPDKARLLAVEQRLRALEPAEALAFAAVVAGCERALACDEGHPPARQLLADGYRERFDRAEAVGDLAGATFLAERLRAVDDGRHAAWLVGTGAVTLDVAGRVAQVTARKFDRDPLVWTLGPPLDLGATPLERTPLGHGSWLLELAAPGLPPLTYPVHLARGAHWRGGVVRLLSGAQIPDGFVYVPSGPFQLGGDPHAQDPLPDERPWLPGFLLARHPVTNARYCAFLDALAAEDPDAAHARVPRNGSEYGVDGSRYWERPEPGRGYRVPERDADGDAWSPHWPVMSVSWDDAVAYAAWLAERSGLPLRLPTEREWEKAARGVDGRLFPWGDGFDASLCRLRDAIPGRGTPSPIDQFPRDCSVYGVRGLAGNVRDWCADPSYGERADQRPTRGGSFNSMEKNARCASRYGFDSWNTHPSFGFRLACDLPG